jgi:probable addiction module antidote protein
LGGLEKEGALKKLNAGVSHDERVIEELREDREYGVALLQVAMESLDNPEERAGALLSMRSIAEAYGGLGAIAKEAGLSREHLYRSLSPKGNPTLKTLIAVLKAVGMRLSIAPAQKIRGKKAKTGHQRAAA